MARLLSINVGLPKDVAWDGRTVHTGIWKRRVTGPVMLRRLNIDGDGQGDLAGHGGEQRAVLAYQADSYRYWEQFLDRPQLEPGSFGENLTVEGLADDEVCIGDRYRIGEAELEVTQPRVTCFRVGMRLGEPRMPSLLVAHHRPGFYLRVIAEGRIEAGDEILLTRRGRHALTVAAIDALLYLPDRDPDLLRKAVDIPALSPGWLGSFQDLLAGTGNPPALGAEPAPPAWTGFRPLLVTRVTAESDAVASIYLGAPDRDPLPRATAGQYLTLRVPGAGEPAPVRSYSLSGDPAQPGYRISVKRESHGRVSSYLHRTLHPGVAVEVAAPRGDFVLGGASRPSLLISAGVGITPVLAMLHQLVDERTTSPVWWLHTTRGPATHTFAAEVTDLLAALPDVRSRVYYTAANPTSALRPGVYPGRLTQEVIATLGIPRNAVAYLCGPATFMDDVAAALQAVGLDAASIRSERFAARAAINPGVVHGSARQPHQPDGDVGTGPAVTFARSDLTTAWSGRYASLLELAEACDVPTRWSCRTGVCHTCITSVLSGATSYNTAPLEVPPPEDVLVCSARPITDLVLDL